MKNVMLTICCCVLLLVVVGCDEEKIKASDVQELAAKVQELNTSMDNYQAATSSVFGKLQEYEIIDGKIVEKVEKVSSEIDRVQPQVADITAAIMAADLSDDEVANWITILQAANQASTPFNPYALPITAGLALASTIWGLLKRREAAKNQLKYQAHKEGVELTSRRNVGTSKENINAELYENIGNARARLGVK